LAVTPRRPPRLPGTVLVTAAMLCGAGAAHARPASQGFYAEIGAGAAGFLGDAAAYSRVGPAFGLRLGYDLTSWLSVGAHLGASTHEATVPPPPEGEYYQLYDGAADARLGFRRGALAVFASGGAGLALVSSNVLAKVDILEPGRYHSVMFHAGGGLEYQLQNRHFAFGLAGQWAMRPQFDATQTVTGRLYLRYTY
jgi:hypothetical protein